MSKVSTLGKTERLKSRKQIDELFRSSMRFSIGSFRVAYAIRNEGGLLQFGIGAGTRNFKKAVDRNRIKRLAREAWRLSNKELKLTVAEQNRSIHVFLNYTGRELPLYPDVSASMEKIIANLLRILHEKNTPAS